MNVLIKQEGKTQKKEQSVGNASTIGLTCAGERYECDLLYGGKNLISHFHSKIFLSCVSNPKAPKLLHRGDSPHVLHD